MVELSNGGSSDVRGARVRLGQILLLAVFILGLSVGPVAGAEKSESAKQRGNSEADELFRQERWAAARAAYDASAKAAKHRSLAHREAVRGAIRSSLKLHEWTDALDRAAKLPPSVPRERNWILFSWRSNLRQDHEWQEDLLHFEFARDLLGEMQSAMSATDTEARSRLTELQIEIDQRLLHHLDPSDDSESRRRRQSELADVDWWWEGVPEAREYVESDERYSRWGLRVRIALNGYGQPIFLEPPQEYAANLPRAKKLLFVLEEIEKLDRSKERHAAAAALVPCTGPAPQ